jgi:hypothetical protein
MHNTVQPDFVHLALCCLMWRSSIRAAGNAGQNPPGFGLRPQHLKPAIAAVALALSAFHARKLGH